MDPFGRPDPNGAEALPGESTRDYIARQEKLKTEARARMRAKFGSGGLGGVGSDGSYRGGGSVMQGVGSNSDYDPSTGKYRGQKTGIQSLREGEFTSDNVKDAALEAASKLKKFGAKLAEEDTVRDLSKTAKSTAAGLMRAVQKPWTPSGRCCAAFLLSVTCGVEGWERVGGAGAGGAVFCWF